MLVRFEERRRVMPTMVLYKVESWLLFGHLLVYRRYTQLTTTGGTVLPSEM